QRWFFELNAVDAQQFNQSVLLKVDARLSVDLVERAMDAVYLQHDALRLGFDNGNAIHHEPGLLKIERVDLSSLDADVQCRQLEHVAQAAQASFRLADGPLIRVIWFDLSVQEKRLLLVIHHLVVDVFSWRLLLADLQTVVRQLMSDEEVQLGAKTTSFKQWSDYLQTYALTNEVQQQTTYWQAQCAAQVEPIKPDFGRTPANYSSVVVMNRTLSATLTNALLQDAPKAYRTEINDLLLSALVRAINLWQGQSAVRIKMEGHGREAISNRLDVSRTVGWFTSTYPLLLEGEARQSFGETIKSVKEQLRAVPQKGFGYGLLRYLANNIVDADEPQITFNYLGQLDTILEQDALFSAANEAIGSEVGGQFPRYQLLDINCRVQDGLLHIGLSYSKEQFKTETVERLLQLLMDQLSGIIDHCSVGEALGVTPSDFPLAGISQAQLDGLLQQIGIEQLENLYPLSPVQEGMLFHSLYQPGSWVYFDQLNIELLDGADFDTMRGAWNEVVARHGILRTGFVHENLAAPLQFVVRKRSVSIQRFDLSQLTESAAQQQLNNWMEADRNQGFVFHQAGVMRLSWFDMPNRSARLIWSFHHVLLDGWSMPLVLGDVFSIYNAKATG
ncbi:MAG TPA: condensation domain-containing protein, partial [Pseudomonadales bacterium]|nr:condensation domain-containing protein [Pseudomonadales bacterium]